jgi:drug/metabolite transporter (DMT)-like permease
MQITFAVKFFAYSYGLWIAAVYLGIIGIAGKMSIASFAAAAGLGAVFLSLFRRQAVISAMSTPGAWLRGTFFVATQYCTFKALLADGAPATFSSAAASYIILLPAAAFFVGEPVALRSLIPATVGIVGLAILTPTKNVSWIGATGGVFQALSIIAARRFGNAQIPIIGNVALGLWLSLPLIFAGEAGPLRELNPLKILLVAILVVLTQVYFVWISETFPSRKVNEISQTRVAWSLILASIISGRIPGVLEIFGSMLVTVAAFLDCKDPIIENSQT